MNKDEICNRLVSVCNSLNDLTITGARNASIVAGSYSILQETISVLLACKIIAPDEQHSPVDSESK